MSCALPKGSGGRFKIKRVDLLGFDSKFVEIVMKNGREVLHVQRRAGLSGFCELVAAKHIWHVYGPRNYMTYLLFPPTLKDLLQLIIAADNYSHIIN